MRTGHTPLCADYHFFIGHERDPPVESPACRYCGDPRDGVRHFFLECPAHARARRRTLGDQPRLDFLSLHPVHSMCFVRASGRMEREDAD
eukprot:gene710-gene985